MPQRNIKANKEVWCCPACPATWIPGWTFEERNENYYQLMFHIGLEHSLDESILALKMLGHAYDTIVIKRSKKEKEKREIKKEKMGRCLYRLY